MQILLSAFWWMRLRSLCKLVDGRDWRWEKLFFALVGRALLSKTSLQLSADGLGCSPSLVVVWPEVTQTVVGLGTPRGFTPRGTFLASSLWQPLLTLSSTGGPPPQQVVLVRSPLGTLLLSSGSWCVQNFVCGLQDWSLFPPVLWKSYNQIPLAFKVRFPGDSQSLFWIPRPGRLGFRTFRTVPELLYYCSPVCGSPTQWLWDLILSWLCSSYQLTAVSSLSLDLGCLWWFPMLSCWWLFNS